jgi:hypothetical protein
VNSGPETWQAATEVGTATSLPKTERCGRGQPCMQPSCRVQQSSQPGCSGSISRHCVAAGGAVCARAEGHHADAGRRSRARPHPQVRTDHACAGWACVCSTCVHTHHCRMVVQYTSGPRRLPVQTAAVTAAAAGPGHSAAAARVSDRWLLSVQFIVGWPIHRGAARSLRHGSANMCAAS